MSKASELNSHDLLKILTDMAKNAKDGLPKKEWQAIFTPAYITPVNNPKVKLSADQSVEENIKISIQQSYYGLLKNINKKEVAFVYLIGLNKALDSAINHFQTKNQAKNDRFFAARFFNEKHKAENKVLEVFKKNLIDKIQPSIAPPSRSRKNN